MSRKPYPEYKVSGVDWLGNVPKHWKMSPLLSIAYETKKKNTGMQENNLLSLSYGTIISKDIESDFGLLPESFDTYQIVEKNNIVLRLTDLQNDKRSLRVGFVPLRGIITSAYLNLRCRKEFNPKYIFYSLYNFDIQKIFYNYGGGVRQSMRFADLKWLIFSIPTYSEQDAIAKYLDRESKKIKKLIYKKEQLIDRLKEKRIALISHAVTKGLNPNVRILPSGVEWLGGMPAHWEVVSLRYLFKIQAGGDLKEEYYSEEKSEKYPYPIYTNSIKSSDAYGFSSKHYFKANTITVTGRGGIGYAIYRDHEYDAIIRLLVLTPRNSAPCKYYAYFINAMITFLGGSTAVPQLSAEQISPYKVFSPPLAEQQAITEYLDRETGKIDGLIEKISQAIEKLKEYRTALISAAITGKIDLRNEVE